MGNGHKEGFRDISHFSNWRKSYENIEFALKSSIVGCKSREHLRSSLGVTNVGKLLSSCQFQNFINLCWGIILSELIETIIKEMLWIRVWVDLGIGSGIVRSSVVSKPDIESCVNKNFGNRLVTIVDPGVGGAV